jgi:hypothetical protein
MVMFMAGILMLMMPVLHQNATSITKFLAKSSAKTPISNMSPNGIQQLGTLLQNKAEMYKTLSKLFYFGAFFQGINAYQTAINTRQPSLITNALLNDILTVIGIFRPSKLVFLLNSTLGVLYAIGKKTDIENNNHPENIREWNFGRLTRFFREDHSSGTSSFWRELLDFFRFMGQDVKNAFSLDSWRALMRNYREPESWKTPQSYQNALASQCLAASFFICLFGMKAKNSLWTLTAGGISLLGSVLLRIPIFLRGCQNRDELDGKLVMTGVPLTLVGGFFQPQFISKLPSLRGLAWLGNPMIMRGLSLNSKSYRKEVELFDSLRQESLHNPKLTAAVILQALHSNPEQLALLKKSIGTHRAEYFMGLMWKAEEAKNRLGVPLALFLSKPSGSEKTSQSVFS